MSGLYPNIICEKLRFKKKVVRFTMCHKRERERERETHPNKIEQIPLTSTPETNRNFVPTFVIWN